MKNKYYAAAFLVAIFFVGLALHLVNISYPDKPVFDEAHFVTYAADYVKGNAFLDIHPPLGKAIYAAALSFYPASDLEGARFVNVIKASDGKLLLIKSDAAYGAFPYVALRVVNALFGALLPVALYFFMRNVGVGRIGASLAAIFILFDNAFLLNTRLILMDGMFILFGVTGLALYFHKKRLVKIAGLFVGLSLAVKLTGIVFVGPVIAGWLLARAAERKVELFHLKRFVAIGFLVLFAVVLAGTFRFSTTDRIGVLSSLGILTKQGLPPPVEWQQQHPVQTYFLASFGEAVFSIGNYVTGDPHDGESPWYFWPAAQGEVQYYRNIVFTGNSVSWIAAMLAVVAALAALFRHTKEHILKKADRRPTLLLLCGYVFCMLPFIVFVRRSTFLYHYLPALVFAFGLLGAFAARRLVKADDWGDLTPPKIFMLIMIVLVVLAGFLYVAPVTYGL